MPRSPRHSELHNLPDVRDGLTRLERTVLAVLREAAREEPRRRLRTAEVYGRVVERAPVSPAEFQAVLKRLMG